MNEKYRMERGDHYESKPAAGYGAVILLFPVADH
jgi:hypothetical protein